MSSRSLTLLVVAIVVVAVVVTVEAGGGSGERMIAVRTPAVTATASAMAGIAAEERAPAVTARGIDQHLEMLQAIATRSQGTRAAGTPGDDATVDYVARELRLAGWTVATPSLRVPVFIEGPGSPVLRAGGRAVPGREVQTLAYSGSGDVTARVRPIALDLGRSSDSGCRRSDFRDLRRGEVALVQRGECLLSIKARNAQAAGAGAVIIANDGLPGRTRAFSGTLGAPGLRIPAVVVGSMTVARLVGRRVQVRVDAISKRATVRNVVADSPAVAEADRIVMAGAHLDSVPAGPGINDDGSGVAALLEASEALRDVPVRLGFWNAEELGLDGSRRYVVTLPARQRRRIGAYVNLDMVGTPGGSPRVYGDPPVVRALRRAAGGTRLGSTDIGGASDHASFRRIGIPVGGLFTGLHACYHRACDTAARVDRTLTLRMARIATRAIRALAN